MKKYIYSLLFILAFSISGNAQFRKKSKEKIKTLKIAYLTEQLNLSSYEAEKFWPIYNAHEEKISVYKQKITKGLKEKLKNFDALKESEAKKLVETKLEIDKKVFLEKEALTKKLSAILTYKKIIKLHTAEREFGRKLMRKYRKRKSRSKD